MMVDVLDTAEVRAAERTVIQAARGLVERSQALDAAMGEVLLAGGVLAKTIAGARALVVRDEYNRALRELDAALEGLEAVRRGRAA